MDSTEIEQAVADLEERLEKLRVLYDQYFMGIERFEPARRREEVDRRIKTLRRENIRNTALRFKFQQVIQRYTTFSQYWTRILREIERGTFKRDLAKAAKRFGTAPASKVASTTSRIDELDDLTSLPEEPEELDSSWIEEEEEDEVTPPPRPSPFAAAGAPAAVPAPRLPAPSVPVVAPPRAPAPSVPGMPPPRVPLPSVPAVVPAAAASGSVEGRPAVAAPGAARPSASVAPVVAKRPAPGKLDLDDDDELMSGLGGPVRPPSVRPASAPAAPSRPATTTSSPVAPPASRPGPAIPAAPASRPVAPVPAPAPAAASAVRPGAAGTPHPQMPAARPQPAARSQEDIDEGRMRDIYNRYVDARRRCNEPTGSLTYDGLARSLRDSVPKLQQKHGGRVVDFEVVIKDGKTVLKPVVKST